MQAVFHTDKGRVRRLNEDSGGVFLNKNGNYLAIVADGMGGHKAGEVASQIAVKIFEQNWSNTDGQLTPESAEKWLFDHVTMINEKIYEHSSENVNYEGMGTTIVAAICMPSFATIVNIGDSRCYVWNDDGYKQITDDHSLVNELIKTGQISSEEAEHHPRKNILLKAVGTEQMIDMDIKTISFEEGDKLLLCSDGLSNKVSNQEMASIIGEKLLMKEKAQKLINLANEYGGEDNISVALVDYSSPAESGCE